MLSLDTSCNSVNVDTSLHYLSTDMLGGWGDWGTPGWVKTPKLHNNKVNTTVIWK